MRDEENGEREGDYARTTIRPRFPCGQSLEGGKGDEDGLILPLWGVPVTSRLININDSNEPSQLPVLPDYF